VSRKELPTENGAALEKSRLEIRRHPAENEFAFSFGAISVVNLNSGVARMRLG